MSKLLDGLCLAFGYTAVVIVVFFPGLFPLLTHYMRSQKNHGDIRYLHLAASTFIIVALGVTVLWLTRSPHWVMAIMAAGLGLTGTLLTDRLLQYDHHPHPHLPSPA
jgi:hypothetical protein